MRVKSLVSRLFLVLSFCSVTLFAEENMSNWWKAYQNPVLNQVINDAFQHNHDILAARAEVDSERLTAQVLRSNWYPNIDLVASSERGNQLAFQDTSTSRIGLKGTWDLDVFGKNRHRIEAAEALTKPGACACCVVKKQVLNDLVIAMIQYDKLKTNEALLKQKQAILNAQIDSETSKVNAGLVTDDTLLKLKSESEALQTQCDQTALSKKQVGYQIKTLMGASFSLDLQSLDSPTQNQFTVPSPNGIESVSVKKIHDRTELKRIRAEIQAVDAEFEVAEDAAWPDISISTLYASQKNGQGAVFAHDQVWSVGIQAVYPLLDFGRLHNTIKAADAKRVSIMQTYEAALLKALYETQVAYDAVKVAADAYSRFKTIETNQETLYQKAKTSSDAGVLAVAQSLPAKQSVVDAQIALATKKADLLQAYAVLMLQF